MKPASSSSIPSAATGGRHRAGAAAARPPRRRRGGSPSRGPAGGPRTPAATATARNVKHSRSAGAAARASTRPAWPARNHGSSSASAGQPPTRSGKSTSTSSARASATWVAAHRWTPPVWCTRSRSRHSGHVGHRGVGGGGGDGVGHEPALAPQRVDVVGDLHGLHVPVAWKPPSTWIISPVVLGNRSDSRATQARATGSGSLTSQPERRSAVPHVLELGEARDRLGGHGLHRTGGDQVHPHLLGAERAGQVAGRRLQGGLGDAHPVVGRPGDGRVEVEPDDRPAVRHQRNDGVGQRPSASTPRCAGRRPRRPTRPP